MGATKESEYVFMNPKTGAGYSNIDESWNSALKKAGLWRKPGVDKIRFHDLRYTAATRLAQAGKDMKFKQLVNGNGETEKGRRGETEITCFPGSPLSPSLRFNCTNHVTLERYFAKKAQRQLFRDYASCKSKFERCGP